MPEAGDELKCRIFKGGSITVTLEDRVYPDASAHQYEAGWWVFAPVHQVQDSIIYEEFFLSEYGILYAYETEFDIRKSGGYTKAVGIHVPWARRVKQADMELEQFVQDELYNRSFDAYR